MNHLVILENPKKWNLEIPGVQVVSAREYLTEPKFLDLRHTRVYNLCRAYAYQSLGYYVSLLAAARGHRPQPSVATIQDLRLSPVVRTVSEELDEVIQQSLKGLKSETFELSVYFGRNLAKRYDRLSQALFNYFPMPFLRAEFYQSDGWWRLEKVLPLAASEIRESHRAFVAERAQAHFQRPGRHGGKNRSYRHDLAILVNPEDQDPPSNRRAIRRFVAAANRLGMDATLIEKDELGRLAEYDALFIRDTTSVNHYTYRFASKAAAEGLVVIDDPESIVRCTNKVFLAELFLRHSVPHPRTLILHRGNSDEVGETLGFPCVLKRPDSSFSRGVVKAADAEELARLLPELLDESELVVAQEFVKTDFDWRVGVVDGQALFACRYYYPKGEWRIQTTAPGGRVRYGNFDTLPLDAVPRKAVALAVKAANLVGDGLYGVDIKDVGGNFLVMEVNDNPSISAGVEDAVLGEHLYLAIMRVFAERLEGRGVTGGER